jgi:hypothetical protein
MRRIVVSIACVAGIVWFGTAAGAPEIPEMRGRGWTSERATSAEAPPGTGELDGRTLVVRLYSQGQQDPTKFEKLDVKLKGSQVVLEPDESVASAILVITAEDQTDNMVRQAIGDRLCAWEFKREIRFPLPFPDRQSDDKQFWIFTDALGEPIPAATVELCLPGRRGLRVTVGRHVLDDAGRLPKKRFFGDFHTFSCLLSHRDYGLTGVSGLSRGDARIVLPLVRADAIAAQRAISGLVVDPDGDPVAGAVVECTNARTLGEGLINSLHGRSCRVITDETGTFRFYLPNEKRRDERGYLIPPKTRYNVRIEAPKKLGLLPYTAPVENGRDTLVTLERAGYLRTLRFEDENGEEIDPAKLETLNLRVHRPGQDPLTLRWADCKDGALLPLGTYEAATYVSGGKCSFEPLEVTEQSPRELVFRLPKAVTYFGRVVHGITGDPMQGAFVMAMNASSQGRLCDITPEQWDALHQLQDAPPMDDPALAPLKKIYGFTKLVRTDETGSYSVRIGPRQSLYGFVAFEQDYLGVMYRKFSLKPDRNRYAEVPTLKLFPAARVIVEPMTTERHLSICPSWVIDKSGSPAWVRELLGIDNGRESSLEYKRWMQENVRQHVYVPAGVHLRLKLEAPYDSKWCPIELPQVIYLNHRDIQDLGRCTFAEALKVQVKVINSTGRTIEGIPVRVLRDEGAWSVAHNTDEEGIARFNVVPDSSGTFGVSYHGDGGVHLRETIPYRVGGPEDEPRRFTLQLSDEILKYLLD